LYTFNIKETPLCIFYKLTLIHNKLFPFFSQKIDPVLLVVAVVVACFVAVVVTVTVYVVTIAAYIVTVVTVAVNIVTVAACCGC
jgi:hypothetical protein